MPSQKSFFLYRENNHYTKTYSSIRNNIKYSGSFKSPLTILEVERVKKSSSARITKQPRPGEAVSSQELVILGIVVIIIIVS